MKRKLLNAFLALGLLAACSTANAQATNIVQGTVNDLRGEPIAGAAIQIKNTSMGTFSDVDGSFTLAAPADATTLVIRYIGFKSKEVAIPAMAPEDTVIPVINVVLEEDILGLEDVVVTAIAVQREKSSLGYGTTTVKSDELNRVSQSSALNALQGKVAGAQITSATGAPGGSTRVVLRGGSSFTGSNNALIVIDGVPVDNSNFGFSDVLNNQYDAGTRANDINPQDIESITVLKGAAATALYGTRGAEGALLITTKKGTLAEGGTGRKFTVSVNSQTSFHNVLRLPKNQNEYGQGGYMTPDSRENFSWGPKFDGVVRPWGQPVNGVQRVKPYSAMPNNQRSFFNTGYTLNNNFGISGALKNTSYYFSYNNFHYEGVFPGTGYERNTVRLNVGHNFNDKLTSLITFNYVKTLGDLMVQGQSNNSPYIQLLGIPRDIPVKELQDLNNPFNNPENYFGAYNQNPYWVIANMRNTNNVDHFLSNVTLDYTPISWLTFTGRVGTDVYSDGRYQKWRKYITVNQDFDVTYLGRYSEDLYLVTDMNADVLVKANKVFKETWSVGGFLGGNYYRRVVRNTYGETAGLAIDDLYTFQNSQGRPILTNELSRLNTAGIYADFNFGYKNIFFLELTARNDWNSTLPADNMSYFYPSASASFVFTEVGKKRINPMIISYGKIRASIAQVGRGGEPYSLRNVFIPGLVEDGYDNSQVRTPFTSSDGSQVVGYSCLT